jgi:hypothetical protein
MLYIVKVRVEHPHHGFHNDEGTGQMEKFARIADPVAVSGAQEQGKCITD